MVSSLSDLDVISLLSTFLHPSFSLSWKCVCEKQHLSSITVCVQHAVCGSAGFLPADEGNQTNNQCCTLCVNLNEQRRENYPVWQSAASAHFLPPAVTATCCFTSKWLWSRITASSSRCSDAAVAARAARSSSGNADCVLGFQLMDQIKFYLYGSK